MPARIPLRVYSGYILKLDKARAWRKQRALWSYNEPELTNHSAHNYLNIYKTD